MLEETAQDGSVQRARPSGTILRRARRPGTPEHAAKRMQTYVSSCSGGPQSISEHVLHSTLSRKRLRTPPVLFAGATSKRKHGHGARDRMHAPSSGHGCSAQGPHRHPRVARSASRARPSVAEHVPQSHPAPHGPHRHRNRVLAVARRRLA